MLSQLATRFSLELKGLSEEKIDSVASLLDAGTGDISFCADKRYFSELENTKATAVILHPDMAEHFSGNALFSEKPHTDFSRVARLLNPEKNWLPGIHPGAEVHERARVHESAYIGNNVVIEELASIGARCQIEPGCFLGETVQIAQGTVLKNNVSVLKGTKIGKDCVLHPGCVIGSDGFGHTRDGDRWLPIPQLGNVVIGNDVRIGANTVIDCGALGDTTIGNGVKIDNQVHIAHNVSIGDDTAIAACTGIAGSSSIGKRCTFAGQVGVVDNISICDDAHFTGQTAVRSDITEPGTYSSGVLLEESRSWIKNATRFKKLNTLFKQVSNLKKNADRAD